MISVYLNNAATSFPKPVSVINAVSDSLTHIIGDPGRTSTGEDPTAACRRALAVLFDVPAPNQICLLPSATLALNMVIGGILEEGGHVVSTVIEHNSVLRPLTHMAANRGVKLTFVTPDEEGRIDPDDVRRCILRDTRLVVVSAASNVTGVVQPVVELSNIAAEIGIPILIDAAQSAGLVPLCYRSLPGRVYVAFAGHKGLLGPTGTGGLIVPDDSLRQTVFGGTGIHSESLFHPGTLPLRHEAGTPNLPGIAGLEAGVSFILEKGVGPLGEHRSGLVSAIRDSLQDIPGISLCPFPNRDGRIGIVSFIASGMPPEELGFTLSEVFGIVLRTGLHCAPKIHEHLGTAPHGTVRVSVGPFNTLSDVTHLITSLRTILCGS